MATAPCCPACGEPHHLGESKPGTMLICESCKEVFHAPEDGKSAPSKTKDKRRKSDDRDEPTDSRKKNKKRDDSKDEERRSDRKKRDEKRGGGGVVLLLLLGGGLAAFLLLAAVGAGAWYFVNKADQEAKARIADAERQAEDARRDAEVQRLTAEAREAAAREAEEMRRAAERERDNDKPPKDNNPPIEDKQPKPPVEVVPIKPAAAAPGLRELRAVALPPLDVKPGQPVLDPPPKLPPAIAQRTVPPADFFKMVHSPKHELLFVLTPKSVWTYDTKAKKELARQEAREVFTDISLAPDQSAVFAADHGGQRSATTDPANPSYVHRFDTAARKWENRRAPKVAWKIEVVDANRVLLLESYLSSDLTLNKWDDDGSIRELARALKSEYYGDIEYDPRTGRVIHGNSISAGHRIKSHTVEGDRIVLGESTGTGTAPTTAGTAHKDGGGSSVLSRDGSRFYYGKLQVHPDAIKENLRVFPEVIAAASKRVAFGAQGYYRADTGDKLGAFEFKTSANTDEKRPLDTGSPAVLYVTLDGLTVWVIDRDKNVIRQYAIDGEK